MGLSSKHHETNKKHDHPRSGTSPQTSSSTIIISLSAVRAITSHRDSLGIVLGSCRLAGLGLILGRRSCRCVGFCINGGSKCLLVASIAVFVAVRRELRCVWPESISKMRPFGPLEGSRETYMPTLCHWHHPRPSPNRRWRTGRSRRSRSRYPWFGLLRKRS